MCGENCNCCGNEEKNKIDAILNKYALNSSGLISCLQDLQSLLGFVPEEIVPKVSGCLKVPESDIYSVLTFYTQFNLKPKAKYKIEVCFGTACFVLGAENVLAHLKSRLGIGMGDKKYEIAQSRCFGCCSLAPVIAINGEIFGKVTNSEIDKLLLKFN